MGSRLEDVSSKLAELSVEAECSADVYRDIWLFREMKDSAAIVGHKSFQLFELMYDHRYGTGNLET